MTDRKKVVKGLESQLDDLWKYADSDEVLTLTQGQAKDILALLKKQEPILLENQHKPFGISTNANSPWISRCPKCGKKVEGKQTKFCKYCGQAVKWE